MVGKLGSAWGHGPVILTVPTSWEPSLPTCILPEVTLGLISPLQIQIGCHTDDLTRASKLFRGPLVINRCCLDKPTKSITCLWGGLLYIIVPQSSKLGSVPITVKGAVHAPYYKLGEWKRGVHPWGNGTASPGGCRERDTRAGRGKEIRTTPQSREGLHRRTERGRGCS